MDWMQWTAYAAGVNGLSEAPLACRPDLLCISARVYEEAHLDLGYMRRGRRLRGLPGPLCDIQLAAQAVELDRIIRDFAQLRFQRRPLSLQPRDLAVTVTASTSPCHSQAATSLHLPFRECGEQQCLLCCRSRVMIGQSSCFTSAPLGDTSLSGHAKSALSESESKT